MEAVPNYLKQLNKKKILKHIKEHQAQSRASISKALNISKPTTSSLVFELLQEGWINEKESLQSSVGGGRRPYELYFNKNCQYIIGVDMGGTSIEVAILNLEGELLDKNSFLSQKYSASFIDKLVKTINEMLTSCSIANNKIMAVGIGVPGITDVKKGIVFEAPSLQLKQFPLKALIEEKLPFPIYVDNDVNIAVLGEQWKGVAQNKSNVILITLGTGVGCGIIINGQLYRGASYAAGEIGHMVTDKNAAQEGYDHIFSGYGFLDSHVGGPSIVKRYLGKLNGDRPNETINYELDKYSAEYVFNMAMKGDAIALSVAEESITHMAFALINVISLFNPECVVLGGGISKSGYWFLPKVKSIIEQHVPLDTEVLITELESVSLVGAASLCIREHDSLFKND